MKTPTRIASCHHHCRCDRRGHCGCYRCRRCRSCCRRRRGKWRLTSWSSCGGPRRGRCHGRCHGRRGRRVVVVVVVVVDVVVVVVIIVAVLFKH